MLYGQLRRQVVQVTLKDVAVSVEQTAAAWLHPAGIGGKVNRPAHNPTDGRFIFADFCTREVFALGLDVDGTWRRGLLAVVGDFPINTIGEDRYGDQYVGTAAESGPIYQLYIP